MHSGIGRAIGASITVKWISCSETTMYGLRHLDSSVVSFMKYVLSADLADECIQGPRRDPEKSQKRGRSAGKEIVRARIRDGQLS
jgi:hypothetical protein